MWRYRKARILPAKFSAGIRKSMDSDFRFHVLGNANKKFLGKEEKYDKTDNQ